MRTRKIPSPLGAIILALALFLGACTTADKPPAALTITTASLPGGVTGASYSQQLAATGGTAPYAWSLANGQVLPAGLALSAGGVIAGTPTASGNFSMNVQVHDAASGSDGAQLPLVIAAGLQIGTTFVPGQVRDQAFQVQLDAAGGTPPYAWSIASGALPAGVTLSAQGMLAGTVTSIGVTDFTVRVTDAAGSALTQLLSLNVIGPAISIATASLSDGEAGTPYSAQTLTATGGVAPYSYSISSGTLPAGVAMSSDGAFSGMPAAAGTSTFTVRVQDASSHNFRTFDLIVHPLVQITTTSLPNGQKNLALSFPLNATNGVAPYAWSLQSGALPAGVSVFAAGNIAGIPTVLGTFNIRVKVADALGAVTFQDLSFNVVPPPVTINSIGLLHLEQGIAVNLPLTAVGTPPYVWSVIGGAMPAGMSLTAAGVMTGTPTTVGPVNVTIQVVDALPSTGSRSFLLTVDPAVAVTTTSLPAGQVNHSYSQTLAATGGEGAYTWSVAAGTLPAGLTLASGGLISGTPTVIGTSKLSFKVRDLVGGVALADLAIDINTQPLTIFTGSLPDCELEMVYDQQITAVGGSQPYSWSLESGSLFTGWTLSAAGVVHGGCGSSGSTTFTAKVTDASGATQSHAYTITWHPDVSITSASLHDGQVGTAYNQFVRAKDGVTPYVWSLHSGLLPSGLFLDEVTGAVSGVPTAAGVYTTQIQVTDAMGNFDRVEFTVTIVP